MPSLRSVADAIGTTTYLFHGHTIALRMAPMLVTEAIGAAFARPAPPMKKAVGGSLAPMEPNYDDPAYIEAMQQRDNRIVAATVAWSMSGPSANGEQPSLEVGPAPRGGNELRDWLVKAADELMGLVSMRILTEMNRKLSAMGVAKVEEEAEKN